MSKKDIELLKTADYKIQYFNSISCKPQQRKLKKKKPISISKTMTGDLEYIHVIKYLEQYGLAKY